MSASDFWDGDPWLYSAFKESRRLGRDDEDYRLWAMGAYVYEAIGLNAPVFNPFSKARPGLWRERPFGHEGEAARQDKETAAINEQADHQRMMDWMLAHRPQA